MAQLRIEGFPDELLRALKVKAAQEGTTVKALMIDAARDSLARRRTLPEQAGKAGKA